MLALLSILAFAQDPAPPADPYTTCMQGATTTVAMLDCNSAEYERQDARLNTLYKQVRDALPDDEARAKLKKAELAWIAFRDANCEFVGDENRGGTLESVTYGGCRIDETRARADEFQAWLDVHKAM